MTVKKRVQKILSQLGIASRRHAEILILEKRLKLNENFTQKQFNALKML